MLSPDQLRRLARARQMPKHAEALAKAAAKYMPRYGITHPDDVAAAWAVFATETGGFKTLEENLNYSAPRLMKVWPSRFRTRARANQFARNPQKLANEVYGRRLGNRGKANAGWLYRGSGPIQTTGYSNFALVEKISGLPVIGNPDILRSDPDAGMQAACIFWQTQKVSEPGRRGDIRRVRRIVNGGYIGLAHTRKYFERARAIIKREGFGMGKIDDISDAPDVDVKAMQQLLFEEGHRIKVDGIIGPNTRKAVQNFQAAHGLTVSGIFDSDTKSLLMFRAEVRKTSRLSKSEKQLIDKAAARDRMSKSRLTTGLGGAALVTGAAKEVAENVGGTLDSVTGFIPDWFVPAALVLGAGAAAFWWWDRTRMRRMARNAKGNAADMSLFGQGEP